MSYRPRRGDTRNARTASPHRGMRCVRSCDGRLGNGSFHEPLSNAGPQAQRSRETPDFPGVPVFLPVLVRREGGGGRISGTFAQGPARWSKFVAAEIEGRGYRIYTGPRAGPARLSRARGREMRRNFFEACIFTGHLRSIRKCVDRQSPTESFQPLSSVSEFAAKFRRGESPSTSSGSWDGCAP